MASIDHQMCEQRYFDDFEIGEQFRLPSRTMTDALFAAFALASGDNHPIHYDVEYCRDKGMEDSLRAFIEQSSQFLKPVFVGDTLYCTLTVAELVPGKTTGVLTMSTEVINQRKEVVMSGMQKYLLSKR